MTIVRLSIPIIQANTPASRRGWWNYSGRTRSLGHRVNKPFIVDRSISSMLRAMLADRTGVYRTRRQCSPADTCTNDHACCAISQSIKNTPPLFMLTRHLTVSYCAISNIWTRGRKDERRLCDNLIFRFFRRCCERFSIDGYRARQRERERIDVLISSMHESPVVLTYSLSNCCFFHEAHKQLMATLSNHFVELSFEASNGKNQTATEEDDDDAVDKSDP